MTPINCGHCGCPYHVTPDAEFQCLACPHALTAQDIDLDRQQVWAIDAAGRLGYVTDPNASLDAI